MTKCVEQLKIKGQNIWVVASEGEAVVWSLIRWFLMEAPLCPHSELPAAFAWYEPVRHHHKVHLHGQEGDQQAAEREGEEERVDESAGRRLGDELSDGCCLNRIKPSDLHGFCNRGRCMFWNFNHNLAIYSWHFFFLNGPFSIDNFRHVSVCRHLTQYILYPSTVKEMNLTFVLVFKMSVFLFLLRNDYWVFLFFFFCITAELIPHGTLVSAVFLL